MLNRIIALHCIVFLVYLSSCSPTKQQSENHESAQLTTEKIKNYLASEYLSEADLRVITPDERQFQYELIDLNDDGEREIIIYLNSMYFCGSGGCTFLLLNQNLDLITKFTVTRAPILVSESKENGWRILYLNSDGYHKLNYNPDIQSYPSNPSMEMEVDIELLENDILLKLFETEDNIQF